ncbi:hypothetical protein GCM10022393_14420 [Aquimarina addita]|uniref:Uncharacterized protein n=1 Tax=Aquimarina addita TaxID=870485 RepID=A0ABP7XFW3_9FLAO
MTETEIYSLMNHYFIKELKRKDSLLLFSNRQLISPDENLIAIHNDLEIPLTRQNTYAYFPVYTKNNWDMSKLHGVRAIYPDEYMTYFEDDNRHDSTKKWDSIYDSHYIHNVSKPIYNPANKKVVIKDFPYKPTLPGCIVGEQYELYYYQKTENNVWKRIEN